MKKIIASVLIAMSLNSYCQKSITDDGISGSVHKKYLNKIIFVSEENSMKFQGEIESNFKNEFNVGEPIYFRPYLEKSIFNYMRPLVKDESDFNVTSNSSIAFNFYIDNVLLDNLDENFLSRSQLTSDQKNTWTSFTAAFKTSDNKVIIGVNAFNDVLRKCESKLTTGKHQFKIEIYPMYFSSGRVENIKGAVIASGEITLNVKGNIIDPNDPRMCMPIDKMKDELLTKQIAKDYLKNFQITADDVRILTTNWEIQRNKYTSVIEKRTIDVAIGYKDPKTGVCNKQNYLASQEYVGGKFLDEFSFYGNMQNLPQEISCKCLQTAKESEVKKEPVKTTTQPKKVK